MSELKVNAATVEFVKQQAAQRRQRRMIASVVGLVLVAGIATAGYFGWSKYQDKNQMARAQELVASVRSRDDMDKVRSAVKSGEITEEQARAAREAEWNKREQEVLNGYFKTPAKDRDAYLDKLIDEQMKRMAEWRRDRPTSRPATRPARPERDRGPATRPTEAERDARSQNRANNQSPMQRAQQSEFRAAMQARMLARGIEMGRGRGGPGGRGGGGRRN